MSRPLATIKVDPAAELPIYRQLRAAIIDTIESGELAAGEALPSSRALAEDLGVSRSTVNLTFQELVAEGFLVAVERVGYRVHPDLGRTMPAAGGKTAQPNWAQRLVDYDDYLIHLRKPPDRHRYRFCFDTDTADPAGFPSSEWTRALKAAMGEDHRTFAVADHIDLDDPLLLERLRSDVLPARGINVTANHILITLGTQHGLHLSATALVHPGDRVAIEDPGYPDAAHIFARAGAHLLPCPVDEEGIRLDETEALSLVVVSPGHQLPTNVTLSAPRRQRLLARAALDDLVIIENDHDSELRHLGRPVASLKSADESGRVVHLGDFTNSLAPGLRLGYVVADPALVAKMRDIRRYTLRHPPGLMTRALALYISNGDYARTLRRIKTTMRERWEVAAGAVQHHLRWEVTLPAGGASLWIPGPQDLDAVAVAEQAAAEGVHIETGAPYHLSEPVPNNIIRLGLSSIPTQSIEPGVKHLARVVHEQQRSQR